MKDLTVAQSKSAKFSLFCIEPSDYVDAKSLAAGIAETITVPSGAVKILFSCTGNFYVKHAAAATIPGDVADGSAAVLNPSGWVVTAADEIGVIAPADCVLTLEYYK
jgi:hypothetical protein